MGTVYLVPSVLHEDGIEAIPSYILNTIKKCEVFFVENERTTRRYLKQLLKSIIIDNYEWNLIALPDISRSPSSEPGLTIADLFRQRLIEGKTIGILSEAGCPGVADPGQALVAIAQEMDMPVIPLVGPNSILLALMASGMNGQQFQFLGYLPIDNQQRAKAIKELETESAKKNCTQIFIETPYRNNQLIETLLKTCKPSTRVCMAVDLTAKTEWIKTKTVADWQKNKPDIHKRPAIFLLHAG
jgi:16S rRNA (cytidine1402-2'-O)-methyltransferase